MESVIDKTKEKMIKAIESLEQRFINVRAGRANPSMLDSVTVEYYGVPTQIKALANISVPEARQLMIKPFDRSALSLIEKAIFEANLGITPNNNGECIFIVIPPLTEDRIEELEYDLDDANETIDELEDKVSELQKKLITLKSYGKDL